MTERIPAALSLLSSMFRCAIIAARLNHGYVMAANFLSTLVVLEQVSQFAVPFGNTHTLSTSTTTTRAHLFSHLHQSLNSAPPQISMAGFAVHPEDDMALTGVEHPPNRAQETPRTPKRKTGKVEHGGEKVQAVSSRTRSQKRKRIESEGGPTIETPSPQKKRKTDEKKDETEVNPPQIPPRERPCGHEVHPAHTDYVHPRCPTCRMRDAMFDVTRIQEVILKSGGVSKWKAVVSKGKDTEEKAKAKNNFRESFTGSKPKKERNGLIDINKNDCSYRSARVRLLNIVTEFNEMSVQELAYEVAPPHDSSIRGAKEMAAQMQYGATNAMSMYNTAAEEGIWGQLQEADASFVHKRARKHEELSAEGFDDGDNEPEVLQEEAGPARKRPRLSPTPSPVPKARPRKHPEARVSFNRYAYTRKECNVDDIRGSQDYEEDPDYTGPVAVPKILRTTPNATPPETEINPLSSKETEASSKSASKKLDPKPKKEHLTYLTLQYDGPRRTSGSFKRHQYHYKRGEWAVFGDNVNVDTSGYVFGTRMGDWDDWDVDVNESQREAEEMDEAEWEEYYETLEEAVKKGDPAVESEDPADSERKSSC